MFDQLYAVGSNGVLLTNSSGQAELEFWSSESPDQSQFFLHLHRVSASWIFGKS